MSNIAVYAGTFDPITNGHEDIISRALNMFDEVIVAIGISSRKSPFFHINERVALCKSIFSRSHNLKVLPLNGLLVDFAKNHRAKYILRGLRAVSDFDYEFQMAGMNHKLAPEIETIFLPASEENAYISGTMVREILSLGGDVSPFVHPVVVEYLNRKKH